MEKIFSIILIDDNRILRESITKIIEQQPDLKIIAAFDKSNKALMKVCDLKPDVLLMDLRLSQKNSFKFLKSLMNKEPGIKVIVTDAIPIQENILQYVEAGVSGFILKDASYDEYLKTIRSVVNEEKVLPSHLTGSLFSQIVDNEENQMKSSKLIQMVRMSQSEREMVLMIADGFTNKEIAEKLQLSLCTVKSHVHIILEKMVLNTRIQFAIYALPGDDATPITSSTPPYDE